MQRWYDCGSKDTVATLRERTSRHRDVAKPRCTGESETHRKILHVARRNMYSKSKEEQIVERQS